MGIRNAAFEGHRPNDLSSLFDKNRKPLILIKALIKQF